MNENQEQEQLEQLAGEYMSAIQLLSDGAIDDGEDKLRAIIRVEPRLPEPQLSLGRLCLDTGRLEEAEERTRTALELLETHGPWTEEVPVNTVLSIAHAQLAETLRQKIDQDDVVFGDPEAYKALLQACREHFAKAAELDPSDETADYYAFFMQDFAALGGEPVPEAD